MKVGDLVLTDRVGKFKKLKPLVGIIVLEHRGYFGSGFGTDPVVVHWFKSGNQCWMSRETLKLVSEV